MADDALGRLIAERTAGVALDALAADMRSRQREACRTVIERCVPVVRRVAAIAVGCKSCVAVIGVTCSVEVRKVAVFALRRQAIVDAARMALQTSERNMRSG